LNITLQSGSNTPYIQALVIALDSSQYPTYMTKSENTIVYNGYTFTVELYSYVNLASDNSLLPEPFNIISGPNIEYLITFTVDSGKNQVTSQTLPYFGSSLIPVNSS
jgi:hypothetical protein